MLQQLRAAQKGPIVTVCHQGKMKVVQTLWELRWPNRKSSVDIHHEFSGKGCLWQTWKNMHIWVQRFCHIMQSHTTCFSRCASTTRSTNPCRFKNRAQRLASKSPTIVPLHQAYVVIHASAQMDLKNGSCKTFS